MLLISFRKLVTTWLLFEAHFSIPQLQSLHRLPLSAFLSLTRSTISLSFLTNSNLCTSSFSMNLPVETYALLNECLQMAIALIFQGKVTFDEKGDRTSDIVISQIRGKTSYRKMLQIAITWRNLFNLSKDDIDSINWIW